MARLNNGIMCICASVMILLLDQATGCDEAAVKQCISSKMGSFGSFNCYGIPPSASLQSYCNKLRAFKMCAQPLRDNCPGKRLPDPLSRDLYAMASTMCGSFFQDVVENANCWDKPDVQNRFKSCATSKIVYTCRYSSPCGQWLTMTPCINQSIDILSRTDQATGCDEAAVKQCISSKMGPPGSLNFYGIPSSATLSLVCSKLGEFKMCSQRLRDNCPGKRLPDPISRELYASASTICGSYFQDVVENANCWDKPDVQNRFKSCSTSTIVYACSDSQKVNTCMADAVRSNCGQKQVTLLENILQPAEEALFYPATCGTGHLKSQCMVVLAALFVLKSVFRIL